ncbi:MAG: hypothetical protein JSW62_05010 [Thermoplasmatales archaeon]|nr:MAG: hypothetical protein JSW62_05010 [Thermoplasmatales archaeon]
MKKIKNGLIIIAILLFLFQFLASSAIATDGEITVDFYYNSACGTCVVKKEKVIDKTIETYVEENRIFFQIKDFSNNDTYYDEYREYSTEYDIIYPFIIVKNETNMSIIKSESIQAHNTEVINESIQYISEILDAYIAGIKPNDTYNEDLIVIDTPFGIIEINISGLSLPILTIVLGGLDSFNPCAFFILIFLLNLLLYAQSRRRMILIGGVFIFFSGLLYIIFMFVLFNAFLLTKEHVGIITIIAGAIALTLGVVNIKDFFFFKKGASLSIPEDKKPGLYKQMRDLVKNPQLTTAIIGTIILAATVNFYELLCTLGLPLVFTQKLALYDLSTIEYYLYIFFYNVVYVIPLIIIVLIFVFTLGRRKLTEWHGQIMKLVTGIMLTSFGVLFIVDYQLLENIVTPILLLFFSLTATAIISYIWKKKFLQKNK